MEYGHAMVPFAFGSFNHQHRAQESVQVFHLNMLQPMV
jgi:hypothetical protein